MRNGSPLSTAIFLAGKRRARSSAGTTARAVDPTLTRLWPGQRGIELQYDAALLQCFEQFAADDGHFVRGRNADPHAPGSQPHHGDFHLVADQNPFTNFSREYEHGLACV